MATARAYYWDHSNRYVQMETIRSRENYCLATRDNGGPWRLYTNEHATRKWWPIIKREIAAGHATPQELAAAIARSISRVRL